MKFLSRLRRSAFAFPLAVLAAVAMFVISESSYQQASATFDALGQQGNARTALQTLVRSLVDAETGQRGFLLTNREEYLAPYRAAQGKVEESLNWLNNYYSDDPRMTVLMSRVSEFARNKLSELAATLRLHDEGKTEAWHDLLLSDIGKEQMETVRTLIDEMLALESGRVVTVRASLADTLLLNRIGVTAMTALSLLALYMYLSKSSALVAQREEQQRLVQAERDHLEVEVGRRTRQLTELAKHLQNVREDERNHLARELHDELGALLTSAKLDVARLKSRLGEMKPEVSERIKHLNEALNSGIALKRRIIEDLRPSSLSNLGLVAALDILLNDFRERFDGEIDADLQTVRLTPAGDLTVYRLIQEALTNTAKYARAQRITIRLYEQDHQVKVEVRDDGIGFDTSDVRVAAHGLLGMHYRVEAEGGRMTLASTPGRGTSIQACLPERSEEPQPAEVSVA